MSREPGEAGSSVVGGSRLTAEPRLLAWQWRVSEQVSGRRVGYNLAGEWLVG